MDNKFNYEDYLKLNQLLNCQELESVRQNQPAHDEMLFIVTHQAYELWFKQILFELDSILQIFKKNFVDEKMMGTVVNRLHRIHLIQKLLIQQFDIIETMTPHDFLEFRDLLHPASGFQSTQFRLIENKMGLLPQARLPYNDKPYHHPLGKQKDRVLNSEVEVNLFRCTEKWLERTPFLESKNFEFWSEYKKATVDMFRKEESYIQNNEFLSEEDRKKNLSRLNRAQETFESLLDENKYEQLRTSGEWRLSHRAIKAAMLIQIYRDQPVLHLPFLFLNRLKDIDESFTHWRQRHATLAQRMLGTKVGTGGSSGAEYLKAVVEKHKVFQDLTQLTTYSIKKSQRPPLPKALQRNLSFVYESVEE